MYQRNEFGKDRSTGVVANQDIVRGTSAWPDETYDVIVCIYKQAL